MVKLLLGETYKKKFIHTYKKKFSHFASLFNRDIKITTVNFTSDIASTKYNFYIKKIAQEFNISCENISFKNPSLNQAKSVLKDLNFINNIDGILINQPLKKSLSTIIHTISPLKDIEGIHLENLGNLFFSNQENVIPCTALSVMEILENYNISLEGLNVCLLGRSLIIGKPLFLLFLNKNSTVTICHSKTNNIIDILKNSDLIVSSIGKSNFIKGDMIKKNSILIDVSTNYINNKICGDIDFKSISKIASYISPVPGGIGVITPLMVFKNLESLLTKKSLSKIVP